MHLLSVDLNTDVLKAKRANADRIKDFSKQLNDFNKIALSEQKRLPYSSEASGVEVSRKKMESNRERGMQFAKQIVKPVKKDNVNGGGGGDRGRGGDRDGEYGGDDMNGEEGFMRGTDEYGMPHEKASKLQELQAKHEESRRNVEAIRKSMGKH